MKQRCNMSSFLLTLVIMQTMFVGVRGGTVIEKVPLRLAIFYEETPSQKDDRCIEAAAQVALRYINNDSAILPEHELHVEPYLHIPSFPQLVETGSTVRSWFDMIGQNFTTQGVIGPSNSKAMLGLHEMNIDRWIPMIGYSAIRESPFPKKYDVRINPTMEFFVRTLLAFVKTMGWKRFGILYSQGSFTYKTEYVPLRDELISKLKYAEKLVVQRFSLDSLKPFTNEFQTFKDNDIRIIILLTHIGSYYELFCQAYEHDMYGKEYVYIALHDLPRFGRIKISRGSCNPVQIRTAANGLFSFVNRHVRSNTDIVGITGRTTKEIEDEIVEQKIENKNAARCFENIYHSAFDAIYNMALGYNSLLYKDGKKIRDYVITDYGNKDVLRAATETFKDVSFEGLTGRVRYDSNNERIAEITLIQYNSTLRYAESLAYYNGDDFTYTRNAKEGKYGFFRDGKIPIDGYIKKYVPKRHSVEMKYFIWSLAGIFILVSLVFLFINIGCRKRSLIKMSSPNINNIILVGSILCYVTVIIHGIEGHCNEEVVLLAVGFTLLFGGLFCKTWRVYRIFTAVELLRTITIKDTQLYLMVLFLTAVDAILCSVWLIMSPYEVEVTEVKRWVLPDNRTQLVELFQHCSSQHQGKFEATMFIYKGLLMLFGLFLAFETRQVEIPALNDSKQIGLSIYTVVVMGTLGTICAYALKGADLMNARYAIVALSIIVSTVATVMLLFLPKLIIIFGNDPKGEKQQIRSRYLSEDSINTQSTTDTRSRTVSRKDITDNGNLSIVYENENQANPELQAKSTSLNQQQQSQSKNDNNNSNYNSECTDNRENGTTGNPEMTSGNVSFSDSNLRF